MRLVAILCFSLGAGGVRKSGFSLRLWPGLSDRELLLEDDIVMSLQNTVNPLQKTQKEEMESRAPELKPSPRPCGQ